MAYDPHDDLAGVDQATARLLRTAGGLSSAALAEPSLCPGWTRGHVLAHLSRNADSLVRLLHGAATGGPALQYPDAPTRDREIEDGAGRTTAEQLDDLQASTARLVDAVRQFPAGAWTDTVRLGAGGTGPDMPAAQVLWRRLLEVELHHVDLARTYTPAHWPADFVHRAMAVGVQRLGRHEDVPPLVMIAVDSGERWSLTPARQAQAQPDRSAAAPVEVSGPAAALLAWVTGRSRGDGLHAQGPDDVTSPPALPAWG